MELTDGFIHTLYTNTKIDYEKSGILTHISWEAQENNKRILS